MKRLNRRTLIFAIITFLMIVVMIISFRDPPARVDSAPVVSASLPVLQEGDDVLQIPASALFREEDSWAVYVIEDDEAVRRTVTPGQRSGLLTEIQEGLEPGERVILHPGQDIEPGSRVEIRP